jgi:trans-aconitate 2-methyltransferase
LHIAACGGLYHIQVPTWNPAQYLKFASERTQPCRDLIARVPLDAPRRIVDLGCGPGNSTQVLAGRWPAAELTGLDNSAEMIAKARAEHPERPWVTADIAQWAEGGEPYDLVFSNAALQWVPDHAGLLPLLMRRVAPGGALAVQMPGNWDAAAHRLMRNIAAQFPETDDVREWYTHDLGFYYDVLAPHASRVELWATEYVHVLDNAEAIVEWYRGTGLRPFLDALHDDDAREHFLATYLAAIREAYPPHENGRVLFPFRRIFLLACP